MQESIGQSTAALLSHFRAPFAWGWHVLGNVAREVLLWGGLAIALLLVFYFTATFMR